MANYVTAVFYGLMLLVPGTEKESADVIGLNGDVGDAGTHRVRLAIDASAIDLDGTDARPDEYLGTDTGARLAIWNLTHTEVSFSRVKGDLEIPDALHKDEFTEDPTKPTKKEEWNDVRWLANISRAAAKDENDLGQFVDPDYLRPHGHSGAKCSNPTDVLIRLQNGVLSVNEPHSSDLHDKPVKFSGGGKDYRRALSDHFSLKIEVELAPVITLKGFGGGARRIRLKGGTDVKVAFSTLPAAHTEHSDLLDRPIAHFDVYYSLLKDPFYRRIATIERAVSSSECPPAMARQAK